MKLGIRKTDGSYQWAGGTSDSLAGQFIFSHSTIFHKTLAVCAHIDYQPLPSLCKHTQRQSSSNIFFKFEGCIHKAALLSDLPLSKCGLGRRHPQELQG